MACLCSLLLVFGVWATINLGFLRSVAETLASGCSTALSLNSLALGGERLAHGEANADVRQQEGNTM